MSCLGGTKGFVTGLRQCFVPYCIPRVCDTILRLPFNPNYNFNPNGGPPAVNCDPVLHLLCDAPDNTFSGITISGESICRSPFSRFRTGSVTTSTAYRARTFTAQLDVAQHYKVTVTASFVPFITASRSAGQRWQVIGNVLEWDLDSMSTGPVVIEVTTRDPYTYGSFGVTLECLPSCFEDNTNYGWTADGLSGTYAVQGQFTPTYSRDKNEYYLGAYELTGGTNSGIVRVNAETLAMVGSSIVIPDTLADGYECSAIYSPHRDRVFIASRYRYLYRYNLNSSSFDGMTDYWTLPSISAGRAGWEIVEVGDHVFTCNIFFGALTKVDSSTMSVVHQDLTVGSPTRLKYACALNRLYAISSGLQPVFWDPSDISSHTTITAYGSLVRGVDYSHVSSLVYIMRSTATNNFEVKSLNPSDHSTVNTVLVTMPATPPTNFVASLHCLGRYVYVFCENSAAGIVYVIDPSNDTLVAGPIMLTDTNSSSRNDLFMVAGGVSNPRVVLPTFDDYPNSSKLIKLIP